MSWDKEAMRLASVGIGLGLGFGIMGFILATFLNSLQAGSTGYAFVNDVINAFVSPLNTILPAVISIAFIVILYVIVKKSGLLNSEERGR